MEEIDKEISEMKISLNARARIVAEEFLKNVHLSLHYSLTFTVHYYYSILTHFVPRLLSSAVLSVYNVM